MKTAQIDLLNIGLIIVSALLAYFFPLQVFLLAFSILGPLHYLTEINWMDKKNYFTPRSSRLWLWISLVFSFFIVFPKLYFYFAPPDQSNQSQGIQFLNSWTNSLIFMSLLIAFGLVFLTKKIYWYILVILGCCFAYFLDSNNAYTVLIGLFIPTVIHVYIFTLLFMLFGAKKARSKLGYAAVFLALVVPFVFIIVKIDQSYYFFSDSMKKIFLDNRFYEAPLGVAKLFGLTDGKSFFFYEKMELRLMMFISFIYLYHYLNWFSKTTLIQWHKSLTKRNTIAILLAWCIMMSLFYYDYRLGFIIALFFSLLHVIVEFPLNIQSIRYLFLKEKK